MHVNKIVKAVQHKLIFILNVLSEFSIHFYLAFNSSCLKEWWYFPIKLFSSKVRTCKEICSYNLVYNFLMQLLPSRSLVFAVHFLNAFWYKNEIFPKGSSQCEIAPLLVVFHLPYSEYKGVKICFYPCRYQNQNFSLVSQSCRSCSTHAALVWFV